MVQPWKKLFKMAKALKFEAEFEIELEAGVTKKWTAELASLQTSAFERMLELRLVSPQHFDHFDDAYRCR